MADHLCFLLSNLLREEIKILRWKLIKPRTLFEILCSQLQSIPVQNVQQLPMSISCIKNQNISREFRNIASFFWACLLTSEKFVDLMILYWGLIMHSWGFYIHIGVYGWEKLVYVCDSSKLKISNSSNPGAFAIVKSGFATTLRKIGGEYLRIGLLNIT